MLKFPDNTKASVSGLDDIMTALYDEDRKANYDTADEIIKRLEEKGNYIPSSVTVHREYAFVLLQEYRNYIQKRSENGR